MPDGLATWLRSPGFAQALGPALASQYAQRNRTPIHIQNITRGLLWVTVGATGGDATVTAATSGFAAITPAVAGTVTLSGRPLLLVVSATSKAGAAGDVWLSVNLRGVEVTGSVHGIPGTYHASTLATGVTGLWVVVNPTPGDALLEVVADATTADATVYMDANNAVSLLAVEL